MFTPLILTIVSTLPLASPIEAGESTPTVATPPVAVEASASEMTSPIVSGTSTASAAELDTEFNYNYAYAGLSSGAATGLRLGGSYSVSGPWLVLAQFDYLCEEETLLDIDYTTISAGAGYVYPYSEGLDLLGTVELEYGRIKASANTSFGQFSASDSEVGVKARVGARYALESNIEVYGGAGIRTLFDNDFVLDAGARYNISDSLSAFVELEYSDLSLFTLGVRYSL